MSKLIGFGILGALAAIFIIGVSLEIDDRIKKVYFILYS